MEANSAKTAKNPCWTTLTIGLMMVVVAPLCASYELKSGLDYAHTFMSDPWAKVI